MSMASMCVKICWTTALAQVSCKFGFDCLPFRLKCKIYRSSVFSDFFHEVRHHEAQKMMDLGFWKSLDGLRGLKKSPKWLENEGFSVLGKVWYIQTCFFISLWKCQWSFNFLQRQDVWKKSNSWVMVQKPQDLSECKIH